MVVVKHNYFHSLYLWNYNNDYGCCKRKSLIVSSFICSSIHFYCYFPCLCLHQRCYSKISAILKLTIFQKRIIIPGTETDRQAVRDLVVRALVSGLGGFFLWILDQVLCDPLPGIVYIFGHGWWHLGIS